MANMGIRILIAIILNLLIMEELEVNNKSDSASELYLTNDDR